VEVGERIAVISLKALELVHQLLDLHFLSLGQPVHLDQGGGALVNVPSNSW
jgi:hypothetical protein